MVQRATPGARTWDADLPLSPGITEGIPTVLHTSVAG